MANEDLLEQLRTAFRTILRDAEQERFRFLHDLRMRFSGEELPTAVALLFEIGDETTRAESDPRVRRQARVVLARHLLGTDQLVWPPEGVLDRSGVIPQLVGFYARNSEHSRSNEREIRKFLARAWDDLPAMPMLVGLALIRARAFGVIRDRTLTMCITLLYDELVAWIEGPQRDAHAPGPYPASLRWNGWSELQPRIPRGGNELTLRREDEDAVFGRCGEAFAMTNPGFGMDLSNVREGAQTLLYLVACYRDRARRAT